MRTRIWSNRNRSPSFIASNSNQDISTKVIAAVGQTFASKTTFGLLLVLILLLLAANFGGISAVIQGPSFGDPEAEQRLINQLLGIVKGNDTRPESLNGKALQINITLTLFQLIKVNQRLNMVTLSGSLTMEWIDPRMSWDPAGNADIHILHLPYTSVWKPDIYAYFGNSDDNLDERMNFMVRLNATGKNLLELPFRSNSLCPIDVKLFPFDIQQCSLTFGSWSYENTFIEFNPNDRVDLENFYDNQEWLLDQTTVTKSHLSSLKAGNFSTVKMTYRIRRQSFYYIFNLVIPATVVTVTSVIGIHAPTPYRSPRSSRFQLGIVTLLPMGVLLLTIVNDLPKFALTSVEGQRGSFSGVPLLGIFYLSQILTISISTITYNIFVALERYGRQGHAVPWPLVWLLLTKRDRRPHGLIKGWHKDDEEFNNSRMDSFDKNPIQGEGVVSRRRKASLLCCANSAVLLSSCIPGGGGGENDHFTDEDHRQRHHPHQQQSSSSTAVAPFPYGPSTVNNHHRHHHHHHQSTRGADSPPPPLSTNNPTLRSTSKATRVTVRRKDRFLVDERAMRHLFIAAEAADHRRCNSISTSRTASPPLTPPLLTQHNHYYDQHHHHHQQQQNNRHSSYPLSTIQQQPQQGPHHNHNGLGRFSDINNDDDDDDDDDDDKDVVSSLRTRQKRMYDQWEIVIRRLERISLLFFLLMSAGILLMFFFHGWR